MDVAYDWDHLFSILRHGSHARYCGGSVPSGVLQLHLMNTCGDFRELRPSGRAVTGHSRPSCNPGRLIPTAGDRGYPLYFGPHECGVEHSKAGGAQIQAETSQGSGVHKYGPNITACSWLRRLKRPKVRGCTSAAPMRFLSTHDTMAPIALVVSHQLPTRR